MIFRLTQRLNAKIKAGVLRALPLHENPLADWSAHLFVAGRTQYLLLSNTRSLYSTVLYGKGTASALGSLTVEQQVEEIIVIPARGLALAFDARLDGFVLAEDRHR